MSDDIKAVEVTAESVGLPRRKADSHKGDYGRVLVVGGSVGYTGAPVLSAKAASKCGAGLVFAGVPRAVYEIVAVKLIEEMPFPLPDGDGRIAASAESEIVCRANACDVCLIGPGLGGNPHGGEPDGIKELACSVVRKADVQIILDADGLNAIADNVDVLNRAACPPILTPHPGEFARLGGGAAPQSGDVHSERLRMAACFAGKYNCILVLKGHRTVIALPDGSLFVNSTGGPAMAKGGSGDVLAGMIAAFAAQRAAGSLDCSMAEAVCNAVFLHGLAGDMCTQQLGEYSVTASDIINMLPKALMSVT